MCRFTVVSWWFDPIPISGLLISGKAKVRAGVVLGVIFVIFSLISSRVCHILIADNVRKFDIVEDYVYWTDGRINRNAAITTRFLAISSQPEIEGTGQNAHCPSGAKRPWNHIRGKTPRGAFSLNGWSKSFKTNDCPRRIKEWCVQQTIRNWQSYDARLFDTPVSWYLH